MPSFDISKYRDMFIDESIELFKNIYDMLSICQSNQNILEDEKLNNLFRAVHTLKGSGSAVDLKYFSKFAHEIEDFLDRVRNKDINLDENIVSNLIESIDRLRDVLDIEVDGKLNDSEFNRLTKKLTSKLSSINNIADESEKLISNDKTDILNSSDEEFFGFFDDLYISENQEENSIEIELEESKTFLEPITESTYEDSPKYDEKHSLTIRVNLSRVDSLMNSIGEIVITNAMLHQYSRFIQNDKLKALLFEKLDLLNRHIRELQDSVMSIRMVPMEHIYMKFPKLVRDLSTQLNKKIELTTIGSDVEVDKVMIDGLTDPLTHIIRNAIDHGIENSIDRELANKSKVASIIIKAEQSNGQIIISISDDGAGIDIENVSKKALSKGILTQRELEALSKDEQLNLIFKAGLTTAKELSEISGRGVGMDIVKSNITNLGGVIKLTSERGIGTTIRMILPLTLAIVDGLDVMIGRYKYILPLASIVESLQATADMVQMIGSEESEILMLREEFIPIIRLHKLLNIESKYNNISDGMLIVVRSADKKVALFIDEFLNQHQVVVKPLDKNFKNIQGVSGATVRGDGSIGLILDVIGIIDKVKKVEL